MKSNTITKVLNGLTRSIAAFLATVFALIVPACNTGSLCRNPRPCRFAAPKKKKLGAVVALALRASVARKVVAGAGIVAAAGAAGACKIHVVDAETPAPTPIPEPPVVDLTPEQKLQTAIDWANDTNRDNNGQGRTAHYENDPDAPQSIELYIPSQAEYIRQAMRNKANYIYTTMPNTSMEDYINGMKQHIENDMTISLPEDKLIISKVLQNSSNVHGA